MKINHKSKSSQRGFTLIELIIVISVFVLISSAIVGVFLTTLRSDEHISISTDLKQQGSVALTHLEAMVRNAQRISVCESDHLELINADFGKTTLQTDSDRIASASGSSVSYFTDAFVLVPDAYPLTFSCSTGVGETYSSVSISFGLQIKQERSVAVPATQVFQTTVTLRK
ncbi:MAG: hypothetical protein UX04_C0003G0036 [Microgenomates group bacterium GW2011_GWF2_45_18]|nr:MAG: hypothetical protein UW18_C0002G0036 [Microgenomates group bacterium GW2011_GWF1_44_10]KKU01764.1 MAG: hypothetical protein UX04_C0003G0036 [Microgenomates group bacterium GW2011_GWF2_45_18]OGJ41479.1 MAG: hypothetical protein A2378_04365 [Candidatus Pacebacteria bacterium RIFOXYB1_FULL_44_10]HAU98932.1 hypothetical protein [Candidatus Paceibacterota bacterium]HAX01111.1 hypothetical protein [Candidatus Paceibacterota bacterium]